MAKLNKRPDCLMLPGHGKNHRNKMAWNRNKEKGRIENGTSIFLYRCVNLDQTYTFIFAVPDCLTKSS